jgi:hypothetical protein
MASFESFFRYYQKMGREEVEEFVKKNPEYKPMYLAAVLLSCSAPQTI